MRNRYAALAAAAGLGIVLGSVSLAPAQAAGPARPASSSAGVWSKAAAIPGLVGLNTGKDAQLSSVSCTAPGDCGAGGYYTVKGGHQQAFVVSESNGVWGKATQVPGLNSLNAGGNAQVNSVSCAATGDCTAGGQYNDKHGAGQAFVAAESNGVWGTAVEVPGSAQLNAGGAASIASLACTTVGNCTAGGYYTDTSLGAQVMVVTERNGVWGDAIEVPGSAKLNRRGLAFISSVSCAAPGDCTVGGDYHAGDGFFQTLVATQRGGVWGNAVKVPGTLQLNTGGSAIVNSVSCTAPDYCSVGGSYTEKSGNQGGFVATENKGVWSTAIEPPGLAKLNSGGFAEINAVSCTKSGDCTAGGDYLDAHANQQAVVVTESNGRWGTATEVPGSAKLNVGGDAQIESLSCTAPGDCSAGGTYGPSQLTGQAMVATQSGGKWGSALEVPGMSRLNKGGVAPVLAISCATPVHCAAGGTYSAGTSRQGFFQAFVVTER
jgi:hypothetical protein